MEVAYQEPLLSQIEYYADENIGLNFVKHLRKNYHVNIKSALEEGNSGKTDKFQFDLAFRMNRCLLTFDKDFLNHAQFPLHKTHCVVLLRFSKMYFNIPYMSNCLTQQVLPVDMDFEKLKIVLHDHFLEIYHMNNLNKIEKQIIIM
jgi:predicted nuclease of predicted toxin-antitoxin system